MLTATETAGAIAAIAQAEISGAPGVVLAGLGPGAASVVNGVACASLDRAPLLVFTDRHATNGGAYTHQQLDHRALLAPVTKWSATLDADNAAATVDRALACASAPPPGAVHIDVPSDVAPQRCANVARQDARPTATDQRPPTHDPPLRGAQRPLLLVGLGARTAVDSTAIRAFMARHNVPAMVTYKAKGVVADRDVRFAGVFTNGAFEQQILDQSDLLIGVGLDPVELLPRPWTHRQPILYCGRWRVDDRHVPFAAQFIGDIGHGLEELAAHLGPADWDANALQQTIARQRQSLRGGGDGQMTADAVVRIASEMLPDVRVTVDAGAHMFTATMLWPVDAPAQMLISNGLSTMGFAVPAAIGAALTDRDRPVVALTGDGGLLMCVGELLTAVRERLPIVVIVFSDGSLSLIDVKQRQRRFRSAGVSLGDLAWASIAESVRMNAAVASTEAELRRALPPAQSLRGPMLIEARIDPGNYDATLRAIRG